MEEITQLDIKDLHGPLKRAVLFHDLSGIGKCSITTGLPILSAAGIEGCCAPTAVLSTHTGGFTDYTFRDLTDDLPAFLKHWENLDITFDAIYSGYLGSAHQAQILSDFIDFEKKKNPKLLTFIDPVMGDNGELYGGFDNTLVDAMKKLTKKANVLLPNITEATKILDLEYKPGPYSQDYVKELSEKLAKLGPEIIIITGIDLADDKKIGTSVYEDGKFRFYEIKRVPGAFHGTGDVFAGFVLAGYLNGLSIDEAVKLSMKLTLGAAERTIQRETPRREGIDFEGMLPYMMDELRKLSE